jgi:hypothetical protein
MADDIEAERRADMRAFTAQLRELADKIGILLTDNARRDQWAKTMQATIEGHERDLRGNGKDGLVVQVDRLNARASTVFAVGAGAWALFMIVFTLIAASLFEKVSQLP